MGIEDLQSLVSNFSERRDWSQFHTPKNLVMALSGEVGELTEIFQWLTPEQSEAVGQNAKIRAQVEEEVADVFIYLLRLAEVLDINLAEVVRKKVALNEKKYPEEESRGKATKYTELGGT
ncbi:MazG nucleotide pyrophosphohydrolase [Rhodococcus opacus PD630]|uniref:nucleotide pyrophosphohydrolase n=1 Tax=Rhodococcus opacus TaxID=37919 RepID=UPI00029CC209|nr:nucleotide pyrophosphohydrolase [Rhodococcus opacus]AHK33008.1 dCTP pyrophosphatase 1 [Rhodococcus opacus PD630]EHI41038.1 MazG nucleotide pyrophosphohydrolase [Rhodococcus opacus PD630]UDG95329.1 nucleotide pyrophosphohydrolase [Rhodococcus opacus PD630]